MTKIAKSPASRFATQTLRMSRRFALFFLALIAVLMSIAALPGGASAATPWWQIVDGSRPSNLWEPSDSVQEITATMAVTEEFGEGVVQTMEIDGKTIGCLGSETFLGELGCEAFVGSPAIANAAQLKATLEPIYGSDVEVSGGPVGVASLLVTVPGRGVPAIGFNEEEAQPRFGTAKNKVVSTGGSGRLVLTITNLGNEEIDASSDPVTIVDDLPQGVVASDVDAFAGVQNGNGPVECEIEVAGTRVACEFEQTLPSYESIEIEPLVRLIGSPPSAGTPGKVTVSGGGAPTATASQEIKVSPEKVPFGVERFSVVPEEESGTEASRAGGHPFQLTTTIQLNAGPLLPAARRVDSEVEQPAQPRNFRFALPAGYVGNVTAVPNCALSDFYDASRFLTNQCPDETAIGAASVTIVEKTNIGFARLAVPLFNLEPGDGEPARLGLTAGGVSVVIDTEVDPDNEYRILAGVRNASQLAQIISSTVTIWGTPGDPAHDGQRGWLCVFNFIDYGPCGSPSGSNENAFLRLPVSCKDAAVAGSEVEPWNTPLGGVIGTSSFTTPAPSGCNQVPFKPEIQASPTSKRVVSSSGLDFRLDMPNGGLLNSKAISEGQAKRVEVTLPEGVTINPSQAEGLAACSPSQYAKETASSPAGAGCPEASKVGSVQVKTPLLEEEAKGSLYVAEPYDNPFDSLVALYMVAKIPERGILIKQAGEVHLDPSTGRIVSTFDNLPQVPFDTFKLHFYEGNRAPLVMPPNCGTYETVAKFTPWSAADPDNPTPDEIVTKTSPFTVDQSSKGGPCPSGTPPLNPKFVAGTTSSSAGGFSPFNVRLTREDDEQEFSRFSVRPPKGLLAILAGVPFCSDAGIAAAKARTGPDGGQDELDNPSCPGASQIGRTLVGAGVGPELSYAPGKIYLAGPYQGAKMSIVAISTAKVGPFDLGTVVIRQALRVDPVTAEVTSDGSNSDPIPHILRGVVVHARDIRVSLDRRDFTFNPTNCERMTAGATVVSGLGQTVDLTSPFQAADCASLGFKPKLSLQLLGGTKRTATPRLKAVLTTRKGDANFARAQVTLPKSAFLEQAHIRTVCTRVQFNAGGGNGEQCPKASVYGKASAISPVLDEVVKGPVFLRSSDNELPDLVAALHANRADVNLIGRIDSLNGRIRTTFDSTPDVPVTKFTLEMQGGNKGLIVNSQNICKGTHKGIANFKAQNGRKYEFNPVVKTQCGGNKGKKGGRRK
jgi:hypothetical protein